MIAYRTATLAELRVLLDWAAQEGWNPGLGDAEAFHAADPHGFFVATHNDLPVAGISVVNHTPGFAFLGLYIVQPAWRGKGIGYALWQFALKHAGARIVGLDGVPEQQANYAASGFALAGSTSRYVGPVAAASHPGVQCAGPGDIPQMIALEAAASGQHKPDYLSAWFQGSEDRKTLVIQQGDAILGFCTVRACRSGAKIGPLWADTQANAKALIQHATTLWGGPVVIDVPASSDGLGQLCQALSLKPGFATARMYRGPVETAFHPFFAVATLELG